MQTIRLTEDEVSVVTLSHRRNSIYLNNKKIHLIRNIGKCKVYSIIDENTPFEIGLQRSLPPPLDEYVWPSTTFWSFENCSISNWDKYLSELNNTPSEKRVISAVTLPHVQHNDEYEESEISDSEYEEMDSSSIDEEEDLEEGSDNDVDDYDLPENFL